MVCMHGLKHLAIIRVLLLEYPIHLAGRSESKAAPLLEVKVIEIEYSSVILVKAKQ